MHLIGLCFGINPLWKSFKKISKLRTNYQMHSNGIIKKKNHKLTIIDTLKNFCDCRKTGLLTNADNGLARTKYLPLKRNAFIDILLDLLYLF